MDTKLMQAETGHLPEILEIINHNILNTTAVYDYDVKTFSDMEQWFRDKDLADWPVITALQNGKVIGYGTYGPFRVKEAYKFTIEHSVYVSHNLVGKGVGAILLTELIRLAKQQGYHTMIGGIDADNKGSIAFHEKFGFTDAGTIREAGYKFDRWLDLKFMQLMLK